MDEKNEDYIHIKNQDDLVYLIKRMENGPFFAEKFTFEKEDIYLKILEYLGIDYDEYKKRYYYYDKKRNIHISDSEFEYTWISTYGLVTKGKATSNNFVNSCMNQYTVVSLLFDKAIEISEREDVFDVDGYYFEYLSDLTPALFNNILFLLKCLGKHIYHLAG